MVEGSDLAAPQQALKDGPDRGLGHGNERGELMRRQALVARERAEKRGEPRRLGREKRLLHIDVGEK